MNFEKKNLSINVYYFIPLISLLSIFVSESIARSNPLDVLIWLIQRPIEFVVNWALYILIFFVVFISKKNAKLLFFLLFNLIFIFSVINLVKKNFLGEPLQFSDLLLGEEKSILFSNWSTYIKIEYVFGLISINLMMVLLFKTINLNYAKNSFKKTMFSLLLLMSLVVGMQPENLGQVFKIENKFWNQAENHEENGFLLSIVMSTQFSKVAPPKGYSKETIKNIRVDLPSSIKHHQGQVQPNIIAIMSEAFWDPTSLSEINFKQDPIPFFHSLQSKFSSGMLLSPVHGGKTANTEFEFLTGNSMNFLPEGSVAYLNFVNQPLESLASILRKQGYIASAIHTYDNWFWNRNLVYEKLGFNNFVSKEFFDNPDYSGVFISDQELTDAIKKQINLNDKPSFIFAVSMENHAMYDVKKYGEITLDYNFIDPEGLSNTASEELESYSIGINNADKALKSLVEYYEAQDTPTVIAFFGDHLPVIPEVYGEADFFGEYSNTFDKTDLKQYLKAYSVPYVIWNNYGMEKIDLDMNAFYLGGSILKRTNLELSDYFELLNVFQNKQPLIPAKQFQSQFSNDSKMIEKHEMLQYDRLFGANYLSEKSIANIPFANYFLGSDKMVIDTTYPNIIAHGQKFNIVDSQSALSFTGQNFYSNAKVFINDQVAKNFAIDGNTASLLLSDEAYSQPGELHLQLKVLDSKDMIIAESNVITVIIE
ncbi:LTA synthase family protein [Saccharibacillus endophyticus]|uniref:LTA synthase family protein n=1 Tax=Saccharibacillus endophyticus TaxID=2060666 RepID=UPI0015563E5F|nr:LTA synthase family protein [Saccharibacillus endophyticus]